MAKYGWDIDDLRKKALDAFQTSEETIVHLDKEYNNSLYEAYLRLIRIVQANDGTLDEKKISSNEWLKAIKRDKALDDYDIETKEIRKRILDSFNGFSKTPSPTFSETLNHDYMIYLLGDIIHEIFGDENYQVYKDRIISTPSRLQLTKGDMDSLTSLFVVGGYVDIYTSIPGVKNINFIANLAHESGHTYRFVKNEYLSFPENKLKEFESFSYEIRVLDYMIKNNLYSREALKAMIKLINRIETLIYMLKGMNDLLSAKHMQHLTYIAHSKDLYDKAHIPNNRELLRYLEYVKCEYVLPYIYSALAVFDTLESDTDLSAYREVVNNIGAVDEDKIASSIVENPIDFNNLSNYRNYREKILGLYSREKL